jgi:hypothetical protein
MVPLGLLVGVAAVDLSTLRSSVRHRADRDGASAGAPAVSGPARWGPGLGLGLLGVILLIEAGAAGLAVLNPRAPLHGLSAERRDAMAWVDANLEADARFAVVTGDSWAVDPDSEWFPALAHRVSVATVQGSEWLGQTAFRAQLNAHGELQDCVEADSAGCVRAWLAEWPTDYVFIPKGHRHGPNSPPGCCTDLRTSLMSGRAFTLVYDGPGATILRVDTQSRPSGQRVGLWPARR